MKSIDELLVIVQARLSSQRLPEKMIKPFANSTLVDICLEKIKQSKIVNLNNFYLSVYEEELKLIARKHGINVWNRSKESANSEGASITEIFDWWDKFEKAKYVILISACCPMLKIESIDKFVDAYCNSESDGMLGVVERKTYYWNKNQELITPWPNGLESMNTKLVEPTYEAAHCLYAGKLSLIGKGIWMGRFNVPGEISLFPINERESLDIDTKEQFESVETLYKKYI